MPVTADKLSAAPSTSADEWGRSAVEVNIQRVMRPNKVLRTMAKARRNQIEPTLENELMSSVIGGRL